MDSEQDIKLALLVEKVVTRRKSKETTNSCDSSPCSINKSNSRVCIFYCNEMHKSKGPWLSPAGLQACPSKNLRQVFFLLPFHLLPMPVSPQGCKRRRNGIFWNQTCEPHCQPVKFEVHNSCLARCQCWPCTYIVGLMVDWFFCVF